ncbi:uncharacterized protein PFLUO_LOCUS2200 [Penicillium psychrofluorescens]|uniref:uncharacterized protein n=1 Tax=Penicillium psychrofluorescens TaxID=3158075 RepID=UPI003CCD7EEF
MDFHASKFRGVTDDYVGENSLESYNARAENQAKRHRREPHFSDTSAFEYVHRPSSLEERNAKCHGRWDVLTQNQRDYIRSAIRRDRWKEFIDREGLIPEEQAEPGAIPAGRDHDQRAPQNDATSDLDYSPRFNPAADVDVDASSAPWLLPQSNGLAFTDLTLAPDEQTHEDLQDIDIDDMEVNQDELNALVETALTQTSSTATIDEDTCYVLG